MSIFSAVDIQPLRERLSGWPTINASELGDSYLLAKLLAAEGYASARMRVFFEPTEILPEAATQAERDAFDEAEPPIPWAEEPGYPVDPEAFHNERWGLIQARHRPVIQIHSIKYVYPQPLTTVFDVPAEWIRIDRKYGQISLLPGPVSAQIPLWSLSLMGAGRVVPHVIQVRYQAGLKNARTKYPHLLDLLYRLALLGILRDQFLPQSGSISADGLSESASFDLDKFGGQLNSEIDALRDAILGIRMTVL